MHHIGIDRAHKHKRVQVLIPEREIRVINPSTGELLRELTLDTTRDYQLQNPRNAPRRRAKCRRCTESFMNDDPRHYFGGTGGI